MNKPFEFNQGRPLATERAGVTVTKVGVQLGAEISGVDLRRPLPDDQFKVVGDALVEHELIIFRRQDISSNNLMDFGRRFNELTVHPFAPNEGKNAPELIKLGTTRRPRRTEPTSGIRRDLPRRAANGDHSGCQGSPAGWWRHHVCEHERGL